MRSLLLLCVAGIFLACSEASPPPAPPPPATLSSLTILPEDPTLRVPEPLRLTAQGAFSDGSRQDLTEEVRWESSNPDIVTVQMEAGQRGTLTGHASGTATITAVSSNPTRRDTVTVSVVMPAPTVTSLTPDSGPALGGTRVTVKGTGFTPLTSIYIGGLFLGDVTRVDDTTLIGTTQEGPVGTHDVEARDPNHGLTLRANAFRYYDTWQPASVGMYGSSVRAMVRAPDRSSTLYAATDGGGAYKSTDAGLTWTPINEGLGSFDSYSLAVEPLAPSTLYAATGNGVYKSTDGGAHWVHTSAGFEFLIANALVLDPTAPGTLYVSVPFRGVYKSTDGAATWRLTGPGLGDAPYVESLAMDPANPQVLYAGMSSNGAIYKTTNGGASWAPVGAGVPAVLGGLTALVVHPTSEGTLYAMSRFNIYKSTNGGTDWTTVSSGLTANSQLEAVVIDGASPDTLYLATWDGVFKTTNGAASWSRVNTGIPTQVIFSLMLDPSQPGVLYAGTSSWGVYKTVSGGSLWSSTTTGQTNVLVFALAFVPAAPDTAYAATTTGIYKTVDSGATWTRASAGLENRSTSGLAIHPNGEVLYASTDGGIYKSSNGGSAWTRVFTTTAFVQSLTLHPTTPDTLYASTTDGVYRTQNGGGQWTLLGQGLPAEWFHAVAISSQTPSTLYAATSSKVYKSTNSGAQWVEMSRGLPESPAIRQLLIEPGTADTVYLSAYNEGVFKTVDGGAQWIQVYDGNARSLAMDPSNPARVYLGTSNIRESRDGGLTWKPVSLSFRSEVMTLALKPSAPQTLLAGTERRGVFKTVTAGQ